MNLPLHQAMDGAFVRDLDESSPLLIGQRPDDRDGAKEAVMNASILLLALGYSIDLTVNALNVPVGLAAQVELKGQDRACGQR
jgi:hypothetical protein